MTSAELQSGIRIADEDIYLNEKRHKEPKEQFKQMYHCLDLDNSPDGSSLCDIGCAAGELLYFVAGQKPSMKLYGTDVSELLVEAAKKELPSAEFFCSSADEPNSMPANAYDYVTSIGVIGIFDSPKNSIDNCINALKSGGKAVILANFNRHPIDLLTRYKRADQNDAPLELGWNVHSRHTCEAIASQHDSVKSISWHDFKLPFELAPKDDPMRCWTTKVGNDEHFHVNGASLLIDIQMMLIEKA